VEELDARPTCRYWQSELLAELTPQPAVFLCGQRSDIGKVVPAIAGEGAAALAGREYD